MEHPWNYGTSLDILLADLARYCLFVAFIFTTRNYVSKIKTWKNEEKVPHFNATRLKTTAQLKWTSFRVVCHLHFIHAKFIFRDCSIKGGCCHSSLFFFNFHSTNSQFHEPIKQSIELIINFFFFLWSLMNGSFIQMIINYSVHRIVCMHTAQPVLIANSNIRILVCVFHKLTLNQWKLIFEFILQNHFYILLNKYFF